MIKHKTQTSFRHGTLLLESGANVLCVSYHLVRSRAHRGVYRASGILSYATLPFGLGFHAVVPHINVLRRTMSVSEGDPHEAA